MNRIRIALVLCIALAAVPAQATDWWLVDEGNTTLWYDEDSVDWDDEDNVYFLVYHGAWEGASYMTNNSIELSYDCYYGDAYVWNASTGEWDFSDPYTEHEMLSGLAWDICYY